MKTPEEIKKGLFICSDPEGNCPYCPYVANSEPDPNWMCITELANDALAYIQRLEAQNAELVRETDKLQSSMGQVANALHDNGDFCRIGNIHDNPELLKGE